MLSNWIDAEYHAVAASCYHLYCRDAQHCVPKYGGLLHHRRMLVDTHWKHVQSLSDVNRRGVRDVRC